MAELSDAFIALPGGWGTLEELVEVTTWTQRLGTPRNPWFLPRKTMDFPGKTMVFLDLSHEIYIGVLKM